MEKSHRVPADIVLLRTTEVEGSCFLRTDQLDGETDWKKREALAVTQKMSDQQILNLGDATCYVEAPSKVGPVFFGKMLQRMSIMESYWVRVLVCALCTTIVICAL